MPTDMIQPDRPKGPASHVEVIRTYLEMNHPGALRRVALPAEVRIEQVLHCPVSFHRFLYREVGKLYHWRDRLNWTDEAIRSYLDDDTITLYVLYQEGAPAGYFELRRWEDASTEIAYFGLLPEFTGRGLGKALLSGAVERAWASGATRVWLHTCTLDDPAALPNYLKRGFQSFREERYSTTL
ncbi:MAG: GNAT family N-acetyltransferase [Gemmatimonadota bacterium]